MAGINAAARQALAEVKSKFDTHEMEPEAAEAAEGLRKAFQKLGVELFKQLPDGRNKSLAMTHLEDSSMRAIRALSHDKQAAPTNPAVVETQPTETPVPLSSAGGAVGTARPRPRKRTAKTA